MKRVTIERGVSSVVPSLILFSAVTGLSTVGCTPSQPTEIVAGVTTQIRVPDDLNTVAMVVQVGGEVRFCNQYPVFDGTARLPATLGVLGASNAQSSGPVTVKVVGLRDDSEFCFTETAPKNTMVIRSRRVTFVDDQIKFLPLPLKESCADVTCDEDKGQTCVGGKCVQSAVEGATLANYSDSLIFGNTNTCFDATNCMAKAATSPVLIEDADTCTFRIPLPKDAPKVLDGNMNVRLFYRTLGSEILDLDAEDLAGDQKEGFVIDGKTGDALFKLAPNLCTTNFKREKILALEASVACPAKRLLQPICDDYVPPTVFDAKALSGGGSGNDGADGGATEGGSSGNGGSGEEEDNICSLAGLQPVESVVYVLMDRSLSMDKFFGEGGLAFAVGLPLSSPVAKRTKVGFGLLPPEAEQCGTNAYATPQIDIGNVEDVRANIGLLLQNKASVLTNDPPQFFLEAALQGAYEAVASQQAGSEAGFNRRAVVVISNRDISNGACPGQSALELATQALSSSETPIFTYAVALDDGETGALESATSLATAGGTTVFNGVEDESKGAVAVNEILTELGTCLYQVQRADASTDMLPTRANISYINPNTPTKPAINIGYDESCSAATADQGSGWNHEGADGSLVRLCGTDCTKLRKVIGDVSVFQAAQGGKALPAVPLVATAPCSEFKRK
jgi:hypothetical protein